MKKIVTVCLLLALLLGLAACGKSPEEKWQEQYELGMKYVSEGNYEEAVLAFTAALEIDPKKADTYAGLAAAYADQGDWENLDEILKNGLAETGRGELYDALMALGGSLSPEEEPDLGLLAVFEEMRLQKGTDTGANSLARDFLRSDYQAFPESVMKLLEPVLEAGYRRTRRRSAPVCRTKSCGRFCTLFSEGTRIMRSRKIRRTLLLFLCGPGGTAQ